MILKIIPLLNIYFLYFKYIAYLKDFLFDIFGFYSFFANFFEVEKIIFLLESFPSKVLNNMLTIFIMQMVPWSRGMISRLQREDHEFESRRNHFSTFFIIFNIFYQILFYSYYIFILLILILFQRFILFLIIIF